MTQTLFDTPAYVARLKRADISDALAEAHMEALRNALTEGVATKADIDVAVKGLELRLTLRVGAMLAAFFALLVAYDQLFGG